MDWACCKEPSAAAWWCVPGPEPCRFLEHPILTAQAPTEPVRLQSTEVNSPACSWPSGDTSYGRGTCSLGRGHMLVTGPPHPARERAQQCDRLLILTVIQPTPVPASWSVASSLGHRRATVTSASQGQLQPRSLTASSMPVSVLGLDLRSLLCAGRCWASGPDTRTPQTPTASYAHVPGGGLVDQ